MKLAVESFSHNLTYKKSPSFGIQHSYLSDGYFHLLHTVYGSFLEFNCKLLCVSWKLPTKFTTITQEKSQSFQAKKKTVFAKVEKTLMHHFQKALMKFTVFTFIFITSKQNLEALLSSLSLIMSLLKSITLLISERGLALNSVFMKTSN